jgi:hypothetical protein
MFPSAFLLTLCSIVPLGNPLPSKQASIRPGAQYQAVLNNFNPAHERGDITSSSPAPGNDNGQVQAVSSHPTGTKDVDRTPLVAAPEESIAWPWESGLHLSTSCHNAWLGKWIVVFPDTCFEVTEGDLMITKLPVCPDGTYAKLAVYEGQSCGPMVLNAPLEERMNGWCLQIDFAFQFFREPTWRNRKSFKVLCSASPEYDTILARNATIKLYAASTKSQEPPPEDSCAGTDFNTVSFPADTCLSGDYYPTNNVLPAESPLCANGQIPAFIYYRARGCTGEIGYTSLGSGPNICIWPWIQPQYWSIIWRCSNKWGYLVDTKHYQAAIPPPAPSPDPPSSGIVIPYSTLDCSDRAAGGIETIAVRTGDCLATPWHGIRVLEPAVCENGTRAQWARFLDDNCGQGVISKLGLVDISNEDVGKCLHLDPMSDHDTNWPRVRSVAFWCDELRPDKVTMLALRSTSQKSSP